MLVTVQIHDLLQTNSHSIIPVHAEGKMRYVLSNNACVFKGEFRPSLASAGANLFSESSSPTLPFIS